MDTHNHLPLLSDNSHDGQTHRSGYNNNSPWTTKHASQAVQVRKVESTSSAPESTQRFKRNNPGILKQWWVEISSCMLMLCMLGAIIGILLPYDNQPLPQWPYHISINTLIAVLTTVLKATALLILAEGISQLKWEWFTKDRRLHDLVVFDAASRGPIGCIQLILNGRGGHLIASLGAVVIILSLAVDPFTQQVVRYWDCRRNNAQSQALLPRSTFYDEAGAHTSAGIWPIATVNLGYIDQGLYNPSTQRAPFVCPSGNCTFTEPYSTIGYCVKCEDISQQLTIKNVTIYRPSVDSETNITSDQPEYWINTTAPDGSYAATGSGSGSETWFTAKYGGVGDITIIQAWHESLGDDEHFYADTLGQGCDTAYSNATWACSGKGGSGAARCSFYPCVRTYSAKVEESKLQEELVATSYMFPANSQEGSNIPCYTAADIRCAGADAVTRLAHAGFKVNDDTIVIPWNVLVDQNGSASIWAPDTIGFDNGITVPGPLLNTTDLPLDIIPAQCIYGMEYWGTSSISDYLTDYLSGSISPGANGVSADGPPQIRALFNDTNASFQSINDTFHSIAEGLTLRMRQYQSPGYLPVAKAVQGVVVDYHTCVRVRWAYLAFPASIVLFTVIFLVAMISLTRHSTMGAVAADWKSSPLPAMLNGLTMSSPLGDGNVVETRNTLSTDQDGSSLKSMERMSKTATAKLNADRRYQVVENLEARSIK